MNTISTTPLTEIRRLAKRASFDRDALYQFIDQTLLCFLGFSYENQVRVIPTCQWRDGDYLYWHAHSKAGNIVHTQSSKVCITLGEINSLVLARSAFHHSINYQSAMIFGIPELVTAPEEKVNQFKIFVNKISANRWNDLRPITDTEIKATGMMKIKIEEVSFKCRDEGVNDDAADMDWPVWAGLIPLETVLTAPIQDPQQSQPYSLPALPRLY